MLIELKRCNFIGNVSGILFFISILAGKKKISKDEIRNRCSLENDITINYLGAIAFFEYLKLVNTTPDLVIPLHPLDKLALKNQDDIVRELAILCIDRLVEDGIFDKNATGFNPEKGSLTIKHFAFPLAYAAIRNFLTMIGVLEKENNGEICVSGEYEHEWAKQLSNRRKKYSLKQLIEQQQLQNSRGLEAEEFVLELERKRLPHMAQMIKRISDVDVAAGYDIVSFEDNCATHYDRFIEVKCYIGLPHFFWSENEVDVAKVKLDKYILCLVDYLRMRDPTYSPTFIRNPHQVIFNGNEWLVNSASYKIKKI